LLHPELTNRHGSGRTSRKDRQSFSESLRGALNSFAHLAARLENRQTCFFSSEAAIRASQSCTQVQWRRSIGSGLPVLIFDAEIFFQPDQRRSFDDSSAILSWPFVISRSIGSRSANSYSPKWNIRRSPGS